jgi:hypothetical protein
MEPGDNQSHTHQHEGSKNPNPPQPPNINKEIDEGLTSLRSIILLTTGLTFLQHSIFMLHIPNTLM